MSPRTMAPIYLSSAQENMKKFQEENRFNVKNIKPKDLDKSGLEKPSHAPSPLITGRVVSVATPGQFQSPDVRKPGPNRPDMSKFIGVSPSVASTKESGSQHSVLSEEINFVNVNLGGYNPNQTLLSQLTEASGSNKSSVQNTPVIAKKTTKSTVKKALNVQETLLKYLGMPSSAKTEKKAETQEGTQPTQ